MKKFLIILLILLSVFLFSKSFVENLDTSQFPLVKIIYSSTEKFNEGISYAKENGHPVKVEIKLLEKHFITELNVIFVIDTSGSMEDNISNVLKRLRDFSKFVNQQGLEVNFTVVLYGDRGNTEVLKWNGKERLSSDELTNLEHTITSQHLGGVEAHMEGIKKAVDIINKYSKNNYETFNLVILMTDEPLYKSADTVDGELNNKLTPELENYFKNSKNTKLLALLAEDAYMDNGFEQFIRNVDGWKMDLSTEKAAEVALKDIGNVFSNVYELSYKSNERVLNGNEVELEIKNEVFTYKLPLVRRVININSNLNGKIFINNVQVGYTNEKIEYFKVIPPVEMEITGNNILPRKFQVSLNRDLYMNVKLAPMKLNFKPYTSSDFGGFKSEKVLLKVPNPLKEPLLVVYVSAASLMFFECGIHTFDWRDFNLDVSIFSIITGLVSGFLLQFLPADVEIYETDEYAIEYNNKLRAKINELNSELRSVVGSYNSLVKDYFSGKTSYDDLIEKFEKILNKCKERIIF